MPVDVAEDTLELTIELLEAGPPTSESYPYPSLRKTGRLDRRAFRTLVLENPYLRATIAPDLGGRVLRLEDKRSGSDVFPFSSTLELIEGGPRGVECLAGMQVATGSESRLNSMGFVSTAPDFSSEEEDPSGIWWGELCGDGLSLQCRYSLAPDAAYLEVEIRAFNRSLEPVKYCGGLQLGLGTGRWTNLEQTNLWQTETGQLLFEPVDALLEAGDGSLRQLGGMRDLEPRQLDSWRVRIYPFGVQSQLRHINANLAVGWDERELVIQATHSTSGCKIVIRTQDSNTLEMPADFFPEHLFTVPLDSLPSPIEELVVLDAHRSELARAKSLSEHPSLPQRAFEPATDRPGPQDDVATLLSFTYEVRHRHLAHLLLAYRWLGSKEYAKAAHHLEQSLLFNAEDHLTWWIKAVAERLVAHDEEERPELLNAHFLAPLEPALRSESYLSNPSQAREKSALLNPLEEAPESFIEVASLLIEAGLLEEAAKWIDEALRHIDLPMLRYLLAYAYLKGSRMEVQAGEQMQLAVRQQPEPPYPWRPIELEALRALAERFPADGSLKRLIGSVIIHP